MEDNRAVKGSILLVATPIGNDLDLSPRALDALRSCDVIYCEDTRVTGLLLQRLGLEKPLRSHHAHNERERAEEALEKACRGQNIVVVSDAGMPAISDPGERIVRLAIDAGISVSVIPGANAALTALSLSGLSTARFVFEGFLPVKGKERQERLADIHEERRTVILYEAPHRLETTLRDLVAAGLFDRKLTLARELTKRYEELLFGTVASLLEKIAEKKPRGEYVLILEGRDAFISRRPTAYLEADIDAVILDDIRAGHDKKDIRRRLMSVFGLSRNDAYAKIEHFLEDRDKMD